jgi:hypothetical protein
MAERWEYMNDDIYWDVKKQGWTGRSPQIPPQEEIWAVLNLYGMDGWELVSCAPILYIPFDKNWAATRFQAVFKRRMS